MAEQLFGWTEDDVVGLTDVAAIGFDRGLILAEQDVGPGPLCLITVEQIRKVRPPRHQHMSGPVGDLSGGQTTGRSVGEEKLDLLAAHGISNGSRPATEVRRPENAAASKDRRSDSNRRIARSSAADRRPTLSRNPCALATTSV